MMRAPHREADIRRRIVEALAADPAHAGATMVTELRVGGGERRVDLVAVGPHLAGFEIKSAADSLVRLKGQVELFRRSFESFTVVCARRHLDAALCLLMSRPRAYARVGVWVVEDNGMLVVERTAEIVPLALQDWLKHRTVVELRRFYNRWPRETLGRAAPWKNGPSNALSTPCAPARWPT